MQLQSFDPLGLSSGDIRKKAGQSSSYGDGRSIGDEEGIDVREARGYPANGKGARSRQSPLHPLNPQLDAL